MAPRHGGSLRVAGRTCIALMLASMIGGCDLWRSTPPRPESSESPGSYDVRQRKFNPKTPCPKANADTLRVGVKWDVPLFGLADPRHRTWEGLDVDIALEVAKRLNKQDVVLVGTKTEDRERFLDDDCVDIVFSTFTKTPARCSTEARRVDCSDAYFVTHQRFLTLKDYPTLTLGTATQTKPAVCTPPGSTGEATLTELGIGNRTTGLFSTCVRRLTAQGADRVDAVLGDDANLVGYLFDSHLKFSGPPLPEVEEYVAGIRKNRWLGDRPLVDLVNDALRAMNDDPHDGRRHQPTTTQRLCRKWVGFLRGETCRSQKADS